MSCGDPHEVDCREVLDHVYEFLDSECDQRSTTHIAQHLDECGPCLQMFGIEREIKALIQRKCGGDPTPVGLRDRVRVRLRLVAVEDGLRSETTVLTETAQDGDQTVQTTVVRQRVTGTGGTVSG